MKRTAIVIHAAVTISMIFMIKACGARAKESSVEVSAVEAQSAVLAESSAEPAKETEVKPTTPTARQTRPSRPRPEVVLPDIGYDKNELSEVLKLDQMIEDDAWLEASYKLVYEEIQVLEEKTETSMSGTHEDQIKAIMTMVAGVDDFNAQVRPVAEEAIKAFTLRYESDYDFGDRYRNAYYAAEEQISGPTVDDGTQIIRDHFKRQEVSRDFHNGYQPSRSSELSAMQDLLSQSEALRDNVIATVLSQANVDMMVADYQNGTALTDLLNGTANKLDLLRPLDPTNEEVANMLQTVKEKKASRMEEVQAALEAYRFPERYSGGNVPTGASSLEGRMKRFLGQFEYSEGKRYEILDIKIAGPWVDIHHALTGKHLYSQVDFYVAVPAEESGVLEILFVTGKTSGPHHEEFGTYSVGGMGQMLEENL